MTLSSSINPRLQQIFEESCLTQNYNRLKSLLTYPAIRKQIDINHSVEYLDPFYSDEVPHNYRLKSEESPLSYAASNGNTQLVQILLCAGAELHSIDTFSPLDEALRYFLKRDYWNPQELENWCSMMKSLINAGAHIHTQARYGENQVSNEYLSALDIVKEAQQKYDEPCLNALHAYLVEKGLSATRQKPAPAMYTPSYALTPS